MEVVVSNGFLVDGEQWVGVNSASWNQLQWWQVVKVEKPLFLSLYMLVLGKKKKNAIIRDFVSQ